jgi:hypothetical protein
MLKFWLEALARAVSESLSAIGKDPADLRFSACVFIVVTIFLLIRNRKKGLREWVVNVKQRFWRIVGEDIAIIFWACGVRSNLQRSKGAISHVGRATR